MSQVCRLRGCSTLCVGSEAASARVSWVRASPPPPRGLQGAVRLGPVQAETPGEGTDALPPPWGFSPASRFLAGLARPRLFPSFLRGDGLRQAALSETTSSSLLGPLRRELAPSEGRGRSFHDRKGGAPPHAPLPARLCEILSCALGAARRGSCRISEVQGEIMLVKISTCLQVRKPELNRAMIKEIRGPYGGEFKGAYIHIFDMWSCVGKWHRIEILLDRHLFTVEHWVTEVLQVEENGKEKCKCVQYYSTIQIIKEMV
nr:PREDICTED: uncharacterized protein LOC103553224 [Equus przewalskii]